MSAKRICIERDQQIFDNGDKVSKVVINSLDYDILAKIIMLLPIPERIDMEKVCVKWKEASQLAWYDIKEYKCKSSIGRSYDNFLLTQSYLKKILLRCGDYLRELSLSDVCDSSILPFIGNRCKNLTFLECKFDDNSFINNADHFVQAFTQLDKLKCIKITLDYNYLEEIINLSAIINSLPDEINEIHLFSKSLRVWKQNISISGEKFKNLQKLTSVGLPLDNMNLREITTLVYLKIGLYDDHVQRNFSLFNKLINLEYIDLMMNMNDYKGEEMVNFSTKLLNTIFSTCKNLKHLDITPGPYNVAKIPFEKWINFQNLQHLGISCLLMPDLANTIVKYCKNLKHLRIHNLQRDINDTALKKLTELENLESLILDRLIELYEESIIAISNNCKKLKRLEIFGCIILSSINSERVFSSSVLDELSKLQYLEHLDLHYSKNLKDSTIIAIANNCKNLKSLDIENCRAITETALVGLTNLKKLQKLNVTFLDISDSIIIELKGLKELDCAYCQKLTDSGIIEFIKNNPDLEFLNVCSIDNITTDLVIAANQATKNRTNGIILHIRISDQSILQACKSIIKSQWLVVD